jgi:hypothetical protein
VREIRPLIEELDRAIVHLLERHNLAQLVLDPVVNQVRLLRHHRHVDAVAPARLEDARQSRRDAVGADQLLEFVADEELASADPGARPKCEVAEVLKALDQPSLEHPGRIEHDPAGVRLRGDLLGAGGRADSEALR